MNWKQLLTKYGVAEDKILDAEKELQSAVDAELAKSDTVPKSRFSEVIKEKNEKNALVTELEAKIAGLETILTSNKELLSQANTYKTELETFKKSQYETQVKTWKDKEAFFKVDKSHKDFERRQKLMSKFTLTEEGKELTSEQIKDNLEKFSVLEDAGIVDFKAEYPKINPPAPGTKPPNSMDEFVKSSVTFNTQ